MTGAEDVVLAFLTAQKSAQATKLPEGTIRTRLKSMLKDNLVARRGKGQKNDPYLWSKIIPQEKDSYSAETNIEINQPPPNTESGHLPDAKVVH